MKPGKRKRKSPPFVGISREALKSDSWRKNLSSSAKVLYLHIKRKYVGTNNGDIDLHYSEVDFMASGTISKALKQLEAEEWIERTKRGGLYRFVNKFKLTGKYDNAFINSNY